MKHCFKLCTTTPSLFWLLQAFLISVCAQTWFRLLVLLWEEITQAALVICLWLLRCQRWSFHLNISSLVAHCLFIVWEFFFFFAPPWQEIWLDNTHLFSFACDSASWDLESLLKFAKNHFYNFYSIIWLSAGKKIEQTTDSLKKWWNVIKYNERHKWWI